MCDAGGGAPEDDMCLLLLVIEYRKKTLVRVTVSKLGTGYGTHALDFAVLFLGLKTFFQKRMRELWRDVK